MLENSAPFSFADLVERVSPAVVTITIARPPPPRVTAMPTISRRRSATSSTSSTTARSPSRIARVSAGSGFIIDKAGFVVTNNHVVDASKKITVKLPDGRRFIAKLVGTDPATDVALLKITSDKPLPTVEFGDDKKLRVGDWVVAVGNPFGLSNSVTAGIVSSLGRNIESSQQYTNFIQIDAPINRGNSGGPTFDLRGQVIGMNSMIFSPSGGSVGIGFAIPASLIHDVVDQLEGAWPCHPRLSGREHPERDAGDRLLAGHQGQQGRDGRRSGAGRPGRQGRLRAGRHRHRDQRPGGGRLPRPDPQGGQCARPARSRPSPSARQGKPLQLKATIAARARTQQQLASNAPGQGTAPMAPSSRQCGGPRPVVADAGSQDAASTSTKMSSPARSSPRSIPTAMPPTRACSPAMWCSGSATAPCAAPADFQAGVAEAKKGGRTSVLLLVAHSQGGTGFVAIDIDKT